ncbi:MAG: 4Fe-4S binding protein [Bacteroidales bacterium]|nr:4Fe-4S binding protein [Bacteroidales bacterium]
MLIFERFAKHLGWLEILIIAGYAAFVYHQMRDVKKAPLWRLRTWTLFSIVFFSQLILGLSGMDKFLMTGKLHLPVPAMIIAGPIYRGELSFMTFLFISTLLISGPAWCSHLCYFGAVDNIAATRPKKTSQLKNKIPLKHTVLITIILVTILLRWFQITPYWATIAGGAFGIIGISIIVLFSSRYGKMSQCISYCPVGTLVTYLKHINPFKFVINDSCTQCMACTPNCKYDALNQVNIRQLKPGLSCTYCGDCITSCHNQSLQYRLFKFSPSTSREIYLVVTITLHAVFLGLGRI